MNSKYPSAGQSICPEPQRQTMAQNQLDILGRETERAATLVAQIIHRCQPLLRPEPGDEKTPTEPVPNTLPDFLQKMAEESAKLGRINNSLERCLALLEI